MVTELRKDLGHMPIWTDEVEDISEKLRINCVNLSEYHRKRYYHFKSYGKYFRLPLILLASLNSTASVGLQPLLEQELISGITCVIGMVMGIISAIELYMGIQDSMELELKQSKDFYSLAIDIYKTLSLQRRNRGEDGKDYLNKKFSTYTKLCEASQLLRRKLKIDLLTQIPQKFEDMSPNSPKSEESSIEQPFEHMRESHVDDFLNMPPPSQIFQQKTRDNAAQTVIDVYSNEHKENIDSTAI